MKINKKKIICIIPARGGSKRIKNKNIKQFHKNPYILFDKKCLIPKYLRGICFN